MADSPQPVIIDSLRPMGIGDLLDNAFWLLRKQFKLLFLISACGGLPALFLQIVAIAVWPKEWSQLPDLPADNPFGERFLDFAAALQNPLVSVIGLFELLVSVFVTGALYVAISKRIMNQPVKLTSAYIDGLLPSVWIAISSVLMSLMIGLACVPGFLALLIPIAGPLIFAFWFIAILLGLGALWAVSAPVITIERAGPISALRRSFALVKGNQWRVIGLLIVLVLLSYAMQSIPAILALLPAAFIPDGKLSAILYQTVIRLMTYAVAPFTAIVSTLLYIDLRVRSEALDVQMVTRAVQRANVLRAARVAEAAQPDVVLHTPATAAEGPA